MNDDKLQCQELVQLVEKYIDLKHWGFVETYSHAVADQLPYVIYDSEWCRVKFEINAGNIHRGHVMLVMYGRKHADSKDSVIVLNGEKYWCWHRVNEALNFLDGLSPQETVDQLIALGRWMPNVPMLFIQSNIAQKISPDGYPSPELVARMHAAIWEHYGQHLFELFDVRKPDIWQEFTEFISEYHKIKGSITNPGLPAHDKIS